jgi:hypothetical protein
MKKQTTLALAAAVLLSGAVAASAESVKPMAHDTLNLTTKQQQTAWNDINKTASNQSAPANFDATAGAALPSSLKINAVPSKAARDVPALRPYDFAMVQGKLLIVNPSDKKIAEVITG